MPAGRSRRCLFCFGSGSTTCRDELIGQSKWPRHPTFRARIARGRLLLIHDSPGRIFAEELENANEPTKTRSFPAYHFGRSGSLVKQSIRHDDNLHHPERPTIGGMKMPTCQKLVVKLFFGEWIQNG